MDIIKDAEKDLESINKKGGYDPPLRLEDVFRRKAGVFYVTERQRSSWDSIFAWCAGIFRPGRYWRLPCQSYVTARDARAGVSGLYVAKPAYLRTVQGFGAPREVTENKSTYVDLLQRAGFTHTIEGKYFPFLARLMMSDKFKTVTLLNTKANINPTYIMNLNRIFKQYFNGFYRLAVVIGDGRTPSFLDNTYSKVLSDEVASLGVSHSTVATISGGGINFQRGLPVTPGSGSHTR